ncbi:hypothetical protein ElyMa_004158400 [Elysia marginata]|uniref:Uncharacterized protein n=1 Tax=Elysia marginata TaxID=1093978 RepID=A0AAV4GII1_9GAST|nr:hypothetical protein ElyMa_004158400 [Elysia marginata]
MDSYTNGRWYRFLPELGVRACMPRTRGVCSEFGLLDLITVSGVGWMASGGLDLTGVLPMPPVLELHLDTSLREVSILGICRLHPNSLFELVLQNTQSTRSLD